MVKLKVPATCGELIQGYTNNQHFLVSLPIDMYAEVSLEKVDALKPKKRSILKLKSLDMIKKTFSYLNKDLKELDFFIDIYSDIPIGKGMSSSTSDISGICKAICLYYNIEIPEADIAKLCVKIEPSDNIMFSDLCLFNHIEGKSLHFYNSLPTYNVLVLEGREVIDTVKFSSDYKHSYYQEMKKNYQQVLMQFNQGIEKNDSEKIMQAAYRSALLNQKILFKPYLEELYIIAKKHGALGINIAHSGSVVGIIYDDRGFELNNFLVCLKSKNIDKFFIKHFHQKITSPGIIEID